MPPGTGGGTESAIKKNFKERFSGFLGSKREVLLYLVFGVLTTLINLIIYKMAMSAFGAWDDPEKKLYSVLSNAIAWVVAVLFAFFTNKFFVFEPGRRGREGFWRQLLVFASARLITLALDTGIVYVALVLAGPLGITGKYYELWNWLAKGGSGVVVVALNYVFSKLFIFKKTEGGDEQNEGE